LLHESLTFATIAGMAVILTGIVLANRRDRALRPAPEREQEAARV